MENLLENLEFAPDHPGKKLLYNSDNMRVVRFCLKAGQEIEPHTVVPEVLMLALQGKGVFTVGEKKFDVSAGSVVICRSNEAHGIKAKEDLVVMAVIAPSP